MITTSWTYSKLLYEMCQDFLDIQYLEQFYAEMIANLGSGQYDLYLDLTGQQGHLFGYYSCNL